MSKIIDVSQKLGQYMLNGWVLTDLTCPNPACNVPLMRSPQRQQPVTHFCPKCDDGPDSASTSTDSRRSHVSTPPTEISSTLPESPAPLPPLALEEITRRREQSDRASQEIGNRLLQGWTMLADECPGPTCYGIPLVRPPKANGEKDPRKECVICRTVYISEADWGGRLVPQNPSNGPPGTSSPEAVPSRAGAAPVGRDNSNSRPVNENDNSGTLQALEESSRALQSTLHALSTRLTSLSGQGTHVDPNSISSTADAMLKVTQTLSHVKQLEWSERQARLQ